MGITPSLSEDAVLMFAATELEATVGLDFEGRVYLAGGAYKTLLHGRPPRDLDLWSPTPEDRSLLLARLEDRGAARLERHPYADVFSLAGRELEVPDRADTPTLESRLDRFDIALSAVGVELSNGRLRAVVHPRAHASVARRHVLLLSPLVNWRHALGTLTRARRYAEELGWTVPAEEEDLVWSIFDAQSADEQQRMFERYQRTALPGWGVLEEASLRSKVHPT
jgi:hypothetical protein